MAKNNLTKDLIELIRSGSYEIVQQLEGHDEEPYEGCDHNLFMWLESGEAKVSLLEPDDPRAREDAKTYTVEISTFMGGAVLTIWEMAPL